MGGIATGAVALGSTAASAVYNKTAGKITPDVLEKKLGDFIKTLKAKLGGGKSKGKGKDKKEDCKKCKPGGKKPVIFTGAKILADAQELDFSINAPMPLVWQRSYASDNPREGLLGQGWTLLSDSHLIIKPEQIIFAEPNGRGLEFEALDVGESDYWPVEQLTVSRPEKEQYQVSTGDGTVLTFSPSQIAGKYLLSHMQDINGNGLRYRYNHYQQPGEEDLLTHIKTDDDRIFALSYLNTKDQLRLQSVEEWVWQENDPDRKENFQKRPLVNYSYSEQGDLIQVRNHLDRITREFEYKNHIMVAHKVPNGLESYYSYDFYTDKGKVQKNHTNNGESWTFDYTQPQQTTITDQTGRQTTYQFDKDKYLTGTIDALGQQHQLELDDDGLPEKVINEAGQEKSFVYDKRGNALLIKDIDGNTTQVSYHDEFNVPVEISDDFGNTTTLEYDDKANLIKETDPDGATTTYERDKHGQPIAITGAKGNRNTLKYDRAGNMVARTDCSGNSTLYHYDRDSNLTGITDALKQHTTYGYDAEHRLINIHYPDDSKEKFEYNPLGQLIAYTDPKGNSTQYELDKEGRPTKRINSLGGELGYQYDNHGRLTSLINENKAEYKFAYDPLDRLIHEQGIDGLTTGYQYDPVGNVTEKREDEKGEEQRTTKFIRDNAGRLQEKHIARGKLKSRTRYQYDDLGQLSQARNEHSRIDLAYDAMGRLKAETTATKNGEHTVSHSYDSLGNRIQTELPSGKKLNWLYYGSGHLHQINVDGELISDYERDALHREINRTQGNLLSTQSYDPLGRILQQQTLRQNQIQQHDKDSIAPALNGQRQGQQRQGINNKTNNPIQIQRDYQYDQSGELTQLKDLRNGTTSYKYDKLGRITNTQQPGNKETFAFDPAHNLIAKGDEAIKDNRLKVFEDKRYQYDTFGNMTEKKIGKHTKMAFSYDAEHQMKTVEISKNGIKQSYQYAYDPFGRRISKTDSFNTTHFIWDGNRLLSETRGSQTKTYVYEQDGFVPVAQLDEQGIQYYHTDHLGTPRELTDTAGNITWEATYQTWGNTLKVSYQQVQSETENELAPAIQPLRFQGQYFDEETGLHYNRFRYFDPDIGRFISQDPIGINGGFNLYQYAPSPAGWVDPLGLAKGKVGCEKCDACDGKNPAAEAKAWQEDPDPRYPGVDSYKNKVLKKGTILYSLHPSGGKPPAFAVTNHTVMAAGGSPKRYHELTQVISPDSPMRTQVKVWRLKKDLCVAKGKALEQPTESHGSGGATQYFISKPDRTSLKGGIVRDI